MIYCIFKDFQTAFSQVKTESIHHDNEFMNNRQENSQNMKRNANLMNESDGEGKNHEDEMLKRKRMDILIKIFTFFFSY